jgi:hypothetical protein
MSGEMVQVQVDSEIMKSLRLYLVETHGKYSGLIGSSVGEAIVLWLEKQRESPKPTVDDV